MSLPLPQLPKRRTDSHKGDYGRALLVGGSRGMAGAIGLAGMAALRSGAGLVTVGVPEPCLDTVAAFEPSYMTFPLPADACGRIAADARNELETQVMAATCVAFGPGIGRSSDLTELMGWMYHHVPTPLVIDADGLNALAQLPPALAQPGGPRILTPHPGEFRRLVGDDRLSVDECRHRAAHWAAEHGVVLVLKGHRSLVTDGQHVVENSTGNPGMATGGAGDVLTGVVTALVCQRLTPLDAAHLGVYVHGYAGDLAAQQQGETSLIASDLVRFLPSAFQHAGTVSR